MARQKISKAFEYLSMLFMAMAASSFFGAMVHGEALILNGAMGVISVICFSAIPVFMKKVRNRYHA